MLNAAAESTSSFDTATWVCSTDYALDTAVESDRPSLLSNYQIQQQYKYNCNHRRRSGWTSGGTHGERRRWARVEWDGIWGEVSPIQPTKGSGGVS